MLKSILSVTAAVLLATASIPQSAMAREAVVGLSPHQNQAALKEQVQVLIGHLVETVDLGEKAIFFDAATGKVIGSFVVPDKDTYKNPRAKLQANRKFLGQIKRFMDGAQASPGGNAKIDVPALLKTISANYPANGSGADIIIVGSPVLDDPKSPSTSMRGGRVPNDGHIAASSGVSPYGTKDVPGSLEGYQVYFYTAGDDWQVSTSHGYQTERFFALSIEAHGASLQYFGDDMTTLLSRAGTDAKPRKHEQPLVETDKLEMIQFAPDRADVPDIYQARVEDEAASEPIWRAARDPRVGITWDCLGCDLDVYMRPKPSSEVIYFANQNTAEGRLFKDFTSSPTTGFETVALTGTFDLSAMQIAVNHYGGRASSASIIGEIRIAIGDRVWAHPFTINSARGNRGGGAQAAILENEAPNAHWVTIDPLTVVGAGE